MTKCKVCGKPINPIVVAMGGVCEKCVKKSHEQAMGEKNEES